MPRISESPNQLRVRELLGDENILGICDVAKYLGAHILHEDVPKNVLSIIEAMEKEERNRTLFVAQCGLTLINIRMRLNQTDRANKEHDLFLIDHNYDREEWVKTPIDTCFMLMRREANVDSANHSLSVQNDGITDYWRIPTVAELAYTALLYYRMHGKMLFQGGVRLRTSDERSHRDAQGQRHVSFGIRKKQYTIEVDDGNPHPNIGVVECYRIPHIKRGG